MAAADTPLMRQYLEMKAKVPDALLFFRLGDFYELFFEDARIAAGILEIALTSRNKADPDAIPMCGVPHHSVNSYIQRLVSAGYEVALCEQMEEAGQGRGLVARQIVRRITSGTLLDSDSVDGKTSQFTVAAHPDNAGKKITWAICDYSTGGFWFGQSPSTDEFVSTLITQRPCEVLVPANDAGQTLLRLLRERLPKLYAHARPAFYFDWPYAADRIREQFQVTAMTAVHPMLSEFVSPVGALIKHYQETQQVERIATVMRVEEWSSQDSLRFDPSTLAALEILSSSQNQRSGLEDTSLVGFLDHTKTAMGGRLLRSWLLRPLRDVQKIRARLAQTQRAIDYWRPCAESLRQIYDIERLLARVGAGVANARDLRALANSVLFAGEASRYARGAPNLADALKSPALDWCTHLSAVFVDVLPVSVKEGRMLKKGVDTALDQWIELSENGQQWLLSYESEQRSKTGIQSLKVRHNSVFGYYIDVTKSNLSMVPPHYLRKQTTANGERFFTEELKEFEEKIEKAERERAQAEYALFQSYCEKTLGHRESLLRIAHEVATLDVHCAFAQVAEENAMALPLVNDSHDLEIIEGWHPTVRSTLRRLAPHAKYVCNSVQLGRSTKPFVVLTGPNMGGKSTVMRQVAVTCLLAQVGSYVPAKAATLGVVDQIYTRIGAQDALGEGASTFMVEMSEMSYILKNANARSLILVDEIGRGTSTHDGMSLAWALAKELAERVGARTLFATHYHELTQLERTVQTVTNWRMGVELVPGAESQNLEVRFLYRLELGAALRSYGIEVARLAGLPESVLSEAQRMLQQAEASPEHTRAVTAVRTNVSGGASGRKPRGTAIQQVASPQIPLL